jgi:hypothetical protein
MADGQGAVDLYQFLCAATPAHVLEVVSVCASRRPHLAVYQCRHESVQALVFR